MNFNASNALTMYNLTYKQRSETDSLTTKQFTPESYYDEITANINGHPIFPPHNAEIPPGSLRIINIFVSAKGLPNSNIFAKSDPLCALFTEGKHGWHEYGRTEVSWNMKDPYWIRPFTFHVKNEPQLLLFEIYDIISDVHSLSTQRQIGECQLDLQSLISSPKRSIKLDITDPVNRDRLGTLNVHYFDIEPCQGSLLFRVACRNLAGQWRFRSVNPFFVVQRFPTLEDEFTAVYKSSVQMKTSNPEWEKVELAIQFTCSGDTSTHLRILVYDHKSKEEDNVIGFFDTSFDFLMQAKITAVELHNFQGKKTGQMNIQYLARYDGPRLFDYRLRGVQLGTMFAIDFSSSCSELYSNKVQHTDGGNYSYRAAINEVVDILDPVTQGEAYLAYGFADFPGNNKIFSLRTAKEIYKEKSEYIPNAKMLLQLYSSYRRKAVYPQGARLLPVIKKAKEIANYRWNTEHTITIVATLTNGQFEDLQEAIDELVDCEKDPFVLVLIVLGPSRRDLDYAFKGKHGVLRSKRTGEESSRRMVKLTHFKEEVVYNCDRLPTGISVSVKKMARDWLEFINFITPTEDAENNQQQQADPNVPAPQEFPETDPLDEEEEVPNAPKNEGIVEDLIDFVPRQPTHSPSNMF